MIGTHLKYPILLSVVTALVTFVLKWAAYYLTGSIGLLSDASESAVNLLTALTSLLSLWYSSRPVDRSHTYGHEKIEYFSSGLEGSLIFAAAAGIGWYAVGRFMEPQPLRDLHLGFIYAMPPTIMNLIVGRYLVRSGQRHDSIVLEAHGRHLLTDCWTSVGVLVGLGLVWATGLPWLDTFTGLLVAIYIVWTAWDLMRRSFNGLMDHALPEEKQTAVRRVIESHLQPRMDYHALRTRQAGSRQFVDFHLLVPGASTVRTAHELASTIENALREQFAGIEITIHIEPIEDRAAWEDSALVPLEQAERQQDSGRSS
jgi:cation diffusion facilitator family transporter